jgi:tRNA threonylcarbamoyladenosine biosynthesis protein TsaE
VRVKTHSEEETKQLGRALGEKLGAGDVVCLYGELGAGKTVFVKGIAAALGIAEREITSASFIIIAEHQGTIPLYHIDLYRISPGEVYELGLYDYLSSSGIAVIEWAERAEEEMPDRAIKVSIFCMAGQGEREIEIQGTG